MFKTDVQSDHSPLRIVLFETMAHFQRFVLPTLITEILGRRESEYVPCFDVASIRVSGGVIWSPPDPIVGGVDASTLRYQNLHVDNEGIEVYNGLMALEDGYTIEFFEEGQR